MGHYIDRRINKLLQLTSYPFLEPLRSSKGLPLRTGLLLALPGNLGDSRGPSRGGWWKEKSDVSKAGTPAEAATLPRFVFLRRDFISLALQETLLSTLRRLVKGAGLLSLSHSEDGLCVGELCGDSSSFGETCWAD